MSEGMKIERNFIPKMSIEAFAGMHDLTMVVTERFLSELPPFFARFKNAEISDGCILSSEFGNGETEQEAIKSYARRISGRCLVIDAYGEGRKDIQVPHLY